MTQDPKKLPSWMRGDKKPPPSEPPSSEPPPSEPPPADASADADMPPWLREEQPQSSKVKRVAPPPDRQGTGGLPPWLAGAEEEAQPKSYKIGGTELPEEYFAAADALPDTSDLDGTTFDSWMADQTESKREKDIEEEIPDDLLDVIANEPPPPKGTGMLKATGQLPDWFLGLESLDTTEAPEWFVDEDEKAQPTSAAAPLWMSDMIDEPTEPEDELPPADEIGSFFSTLGGNPNDDEETPEIDWYDQPDAPDETPSSLGDDFFAQLVGGGSASGGGTPPSDPYPPQASYDDFDDFDLPDDDPDPTPAPQTPVEIPQNELDAFFSDMAAAHEQPSLSMDDIEDPDLEWVVDEEPTAELPVAYMPPEAPAEFAEENNNWLSELQGIVAGATRPLQSFEEEDFARLGTTNLTPNIDDAPASAKTAAEAFSWPELHVESEPEAPAEPESDWLSGISADDQPAQPEPPQDDTVIVPRSRLTERLYREPEPEPTPNEADAESDWDSLINAASSLDEGSSDSLFGDLEADETLYASASTPEMPSLFGDDNLFEDEPEPDEDTILPAAELQTGWLRDDLFADEDAASPASPPQAASDDDFFTRLAADSDANLLNEAPAPQNAWSDADALSEADFMSGLDQPAAPNNQELYDPWQSQTSAEQDPADDFFAMLDQSSETSPAEAADDEDLLDQWQAQQSTEAEPEDDFFATLGLEDEQPAASRSSELYDPWQQTPATEAEADDDFFAALGLANDEQPAASSDSFDPWQTQQSTEPEVEDDFFATLGLSDEQQSSAEPANQDLYDPWQQTPAEPEAAQQDDDFIAALGLGDEQPVASSDTFDSWQEQPASTPAAQEDDFFATLGLSDEQPAASSDTFDSWQQTPATEAEADDDDLLSSLGTADAHTLSGAANAADMPDLFGEWQEAQTSDDEDAAVPDDFFSVLDIGGRADDAQPDAELPNTDLFAQWQTTPSEEADDDSSVGSDDFFASLGIDETQAAPQPSGAFSDDPFADWNTDNNANIPPSEDFFSALDTMGTSQPDEWETQEQPAEFDFFATLADSEQEPQEQAFTDVDSYLASLGDQPTDDMLESSFQPDEEIDLDKLFSDAVAADAPKARTPLSMDSLPGADEDWLAQLQPSVGEVSASAIVRQKEDRPVEELSDRLQKLRQLSEEIPQETYVEDGDALAQAPSAFVAGSEGLAQSVTLTADQQRQVELLRAIIPSDDRQQVPRMSAIEATYDSPFMADLEDTLETTVQPIKTEKPAHPQRRARSRRRLDIRFDRFFVALALVAAVVLPFIVPGFRIGSLPPATFAAGSQGQTAFDQIDALQSGDLVLVGVEYGASAAAELDEMTEALLRHIIMRSAFPVLISSNSVGLLRSEARLTTISQDIDFLRRIGARQPLAANRDYYIIRYLPGSVIGLRAFSGDTANLLLSDIRGQATNLVVRSMNDFALVTVITDRADDLRAYAEQIAPLTRAPLVSAVSYGASPLVEPYARSLNGGLLIGYADSYTYNDLLDTVTARSITDRVRIVPTLEPTQPPAAQTQPDAEATQPAVRATGLRATPTLSFTPTPAFDTATVTSSGAVNMRIGPSTDNPVLTSVPSGTTLPVIGYNPDRSWVNVQLEDGRSGWISASLLSISEAQSAAPKSEIFGKRQEVDEGDEQSPTPRPPTATRAAPTATEALVSETQPAATETEPTATARAASATPRPTRTTAPTATATERPTREVTAEVTAEATAEATMEATEEIAAVSLPPPPPSPGYRDERWYAMNLGVIASAFIITLGMIINLVRGLLRRGQRA